jgi:hypothetical protein
LLPAGTAAAFVGVQLAVFGVLLGGAFAPNHIGMPIVLAGLKVDFLRRQVLMSRNISGGRITGYAMGGLNYQIEHHLFPYRRITCYLNINALGVCSRDRSAAHWSRSTGPDAVGRAGRTPETDVSRDVVATARIGDHSWPSPCSVSRLSASGLPERWGQTQLTPRTNPPSSVDCDLTVVIRPAEVRSS